MHAHSSPRQGMRSKAVAATEVNIIYHLGMSIASEKENIYSNNDHSLAISMESEMR